ncbi:SVP1-like protein 2 [Pseudocercospora fuligena]|uniref:SVP1-like protein 2 n=1 Tax=Pseudocercospora fuligena TaxID=685502 RepID=A0A8H6RMN6_9PEZI|nr:SVP1-like protein 2 [Pseudocercospora fuligena]
MNTRQAIQPSTIPNVLSVAFSSSRKRFVTGLTDGLRMFRTDNCLTTHHPALPVACVATIAEALDDRYLAFVSRHKTAETGGPNVVIFWDGVLDRELSRLDFYEPVLGLRLSSNWMAVVLAERTILFQYQEIAEPTTPKLAADNDSNGEEDAEDSGPLRAPNLVHSIYPTAPNPFALACLTNDILVLPAQSIGQAQLINLKPGTSTTKRVLRAHNSSLRCIALSQDSTLLATTSEQGTLIRVFSIASLDQVAEFRRGMDHAVINGLDFSPGNRFVASTSDKGTLHVFDLRPSSTTDAAASAKERDADHRKHRKSQSYATHRMSAGYDKESVSGFSVGRSSPAPSTAVGTGAGAAGYHGSVQEYYGLRPPPISASPPARDAAISAVAALKASPLTPRAFRDLRSVASAPFYTGEDPPHWQGGPSHSWTTAPNGTRKRIKNPILPLPGEPSGRPPKGIISFAPASKDRSDDQGAVLYVIGGGSDARWEMFELVPAAAADGSAGWALINRGFRKYLTRQFAD